MLGAFGELALQWWLVVLLGLVVLVVLVVVAVVVSVRIGRRRAVQPTSSAQPIAARLAELDALRDRGAISVEEHAQARRDALRG